MWAFLLNLLIIPDLGEVLKPVKELSSLVDLVGPLRHHVEVVQEKVARLVNTSHDKVVLAFFEKPFGLTFVEEEATFFDLVQFHDIAGLVWELALALVGDQDALNRIHIEEPRVGIHT